MCTMSTTGGGDDGVTCVPVQVSLVCLTVFCCCPWSWSGTTLVWRSSSGLPPPATGPCSSSTVSWAPSSLSYSGWGEPLPFPLCLLILNSLQ